MPKFLTIFGAFVTFGSVSVGANLAPDYDPTDPSQVAERESAPDMPATEGLSGPAVDDRDITDKGRGRNRNSMVESRSKSVEGLLQARCASCHGPKKQKAGVQVIPVESIFIGPESDWVVSPGNPDQSLLIQRMVLPAGHDDIMPPSGEPMSKEEIALISNWVKKGAKPDEARQPVGGSMNGMGTDGRSRKLTPRAWMQVYLKLDLTAEQRASATETGQKILRESQAFQAEHGAEIRALQQKIRSFADRSNPTDDLIKLRNELQSLQAKQPNVAAAQELLWKSLTPEQQTEMRKLLAEPESRRGNRSRGERARGKRSDSDERGESPRERRRRLLEERRKSREREEDAGMGSDPASRD